MKPVLNRIVGEVKPFRTSLIIIILTGITYAVASTSYGWLIKVMIDSAQSGAVKDFQSAAGIIIALAFVSAVARYFHIFNMNYLAEMIANSYRLRLQKKFMSLNLAYHSSLASGSGELISRILNDIRIIQDGLRMLADFVREPLVAAFVLFYLFKTDWQVTVSVFIVLPAILWFLRQISKSLRKYVLMGQEHLDKMTSTIKESLDGMRIIQSFNLENEMNNRLKNQTSFYLSIRRKIHARIEIMGPVTEFVATLFILGIFAYFSYRISQKTATFGDFMAYVTYILQINPPLKKFQESYVRIQETIVAATRVYTVLDDKNEVPSVSSPKPFPKDWNKIVYKNVSFAYGRDLVLKDLNLEIKRGEYVAFVGESGSGKSTIVNLLERFYDPTSGEIYLDDTPIRQLDLKELRQNIALVTQDVFLFSDTIERNIQAGNFSSQMMDVTPVAKSANAHEFIQRLPLKYQSFVGERGGLLSGGEKQRISIARAFFKDSAILILDEATSALDTASEIEVQNGLDTLAKGRTSLVIAHRLSTIQNADRIYVMKSGQLVEQGTHQELLSNKSGEFARFYQMQNRSN